MHQFLNLKFVLHLFMELVFGTLGTSFFSSV